MKRRGLCLLQKMFTVVLAFLFVAVFNSVNTEAMELIFESDTQTITYKKVDVVEFGYEYKVKLNAQSDFGIEVKDGDKSLMNEVVFAGQKVKVKIREVEAGFLNIKKNPDSVRIYQYNANRNSFDAEIATFIDQNGDYVLSEQGLYKIVYIYDDSVIDVNYVYVQREYFYAGLVIDKKYSTASVYGSMNFRLAVDDPTNLNNTKYYYSFGVLEEDLDFTEFTTKVVETSEVHSINKNISVDILSKYSSPVKQYFFVKLVKVIDGEEHVKIIKSKEMYRVTDKVEAVAHLIDKDGKVLTEEQYYKEDDVVNVLVSFNVPVTYSNLQYTMGDNIYIPIDNATTAVDEITLVYRVPSNAEFNGAFLLKGKTSNNVIVQVDGDNVGLGLVVEYMAKFVVDSVVPSIIVQDPSSEYDNNHSVMMNVGDVGSGVSKVLYYVDVCKISQDDICKDVFDDNHSLIKEANFANEGEYEALISDYFGKFDKKNLSLYVKVVDVAGNVSTSVKMGYLIDNVVIPEGQIENVVLFENILDGEEIIGKKLLIKAMGVYDIANVDLNVEDRTLKQCSIFSTEALYSLYECIAVTYDYILNAKIVFKDKYNNVETHEVLFKYSGLEEGQKQIGDYDFNISADSMYEVSAEIYNVVSRDESSNKVVFDESMLNILESVFNFSSVPMDAGSLSKDLVMIVADEVVMLQNSVTDKIEFPDLLQLIEKVKHLDGYNKCAIKGNACEFETLIRYSYTIEEIKQERFVSIKFLDNSLKYDFGTKEFESAVKVGVNSNYEDLKYTFVNNLNVPIASDKVTNYKTIRFVSKEGQESEVDKIETSKLGVYYVKEYFVYEKQSSYDLEYTVTVVDEVKPTIRLNIQDKIELTVGEKFNEEGIVSAVDNFDKQVAIKSSWDKKIDTNTPGTYVVSYWAEDSSGNKSDIVTVTVIVSEEVNLTIYLICGGIALFTVLVIVLAIFIEVKKEKRKVRSSKPVEEV